MFHYIGSGSASTTISPNNRLIMGFYMNQFAEEREDESGLIVDGLECAPCPSCQGVRHRVLFTRRDYTHGISDYEFPVVRCNSCGFVFVSPRPDRSAIHKFYPPSFYTVDLSPEQVLSERKASLDARVSLLSHLRAGKILDIGCSRGEFMHRMRENGWDPYGIDFSETPPNMFNLPVFNGGVEMAPYEERSFDVVTLWAVLEHVHDPIDMLGHVRRFLKKDGRAFILVPNFNSIPGRFMRHDDVPRHLMMFTPKTLKLMAVRAGLRVKKITFGDDIFSGSTRGIFNYIWKSFNGEKWADIVAQNREPGRWFEFSQCIHGRESEFMLKVDRFDIKVTRYLDSIVNRLGFGFIMTAEMEPI